MHLPKRKTFFLQNYLIIMASFVPIFLCVLYSSSFPFIGSLPLTEIDDPHLHYDSEEDYYLPPPQKVQCAADTYPPTPAHGAAAPSFVVDLDAPPEKRWGHVIKRFVKPLKGLTVYLDGILQEDIRSRLGSFFPIKFFYWLLGKALPDDLYAELDGMAKAAANEGIDLNSFVSLNVFYELTTACTSIVARQPTDGRLLHGRNLDFGIGLGVNEFTKEYIVTEFLRNLTVDVHFKRHGELLYSGTTYAGYVTILNGVKKGQFSMSLNQRLLGGESPIKSIFSWVLGMRSGLPLAVVTRRLFEAEAQTYEEAKRYLETVPLLSPVYFILGGVSGDQGSVITRSPDRSVAPLTLAGTNESWVLETNYDHWEAPPEHDNRRAPAYQCLREAEADNGTLSWSSLYDVLSTRPILNLGTTYTSLMEVYSGKLESFVRQCRYPCDLGPASFQGWT